MGNRPTYSTTACVIWTLDEASNGRVNLAAGTGRHAILLWRSMFQGQATPPGGRHAPPGNALSQRFERPVHAVLLTHLRDGLLTHSSLLSHLTSPRVAEQPMIAAFG
jgi:hypothetical protein